MKAKLGNVDSRVKNVLHQVFAEIFDEISEATDGEILVEDLTIRSYSVDVSVTLRAREPEEREGVEEAGE